MNFSRESLVAVALMVTFVAASSAQEAATKAPREKRLTTDGRMKTSPVFVDRTGSELLFVVEESPVQMRLMKLTLADGAIAPVHPKQTKNEFEPGLSPDGQWLAFIQNRGNLSLAIVIENRARGSETEVPPGGGFSGARSPTISPDGTTLLYSYPETDVQGIFAVDLPISKPRPVIKGPGVNNWPSFAPDGKRFVFSSTRDKNYELYTAAADGSNLKRLTDEPLQDIRPRFSPDGSRIVFTSGRDGNYELYTIDPTGNNVRRLTSNDERDDYPTWHPNGKQVVYVAERNGKHDLYLLEVE